MISTQSPLPSGMRLGPYEIVGLLGSGGMADVYRAQDTRLNNRIVAVKVLSAALADTPQRRLRLEREAQAVSLLSHPNICALYDIGEDRGRPFLVMEYVAGETLAQRLRRGALPLAEALRLAILMADALDHAHRQGVVHRDLKPANVMLSPAGVKLVDFGLAKLRDPDSEATSVVDDTESLTADGVLLGTLPYMAPEQVEAKQADSRSDVFAFGAVVYEMIAARRAFDAESKAGLIVALLEHDPPSLETLLGSKAGSETDAVPIRLLDHVIGRCLAKQPEDRWQTAADLKRELRWIAESHWTAASRRATGRRSWLTIGLVTAALGSAAAVPWFLGRSAPLASAAIPAVTATYALPLAPGTTFVSGPAAAQAAVSPDGQWIAYSAGTSSVASQLWLCHLSDGVLRPLPHTDGALYPFWSPDSRSVGFFAGGHLKTTDLEDNAPVSLASAPSPTGGAWGGDDTIVFGPLRGGLLRVSTKTSVVAPVTRADETKGDRGHSWPAFLPDGRHFIYFVENRDPERSGIAVGSTSAIADANPLLMATEGQAAYARGSLIFGREGTLFARPFDPVRQVFHGDAVPIVTGVAFNRGNGRVAFTISDSTLVYRRGSEGGATASRLAWRDRHGAIIGGLGDPATYTALAGSPDGRYILATGDHPAQLHLFDLRTGGRQVSTGTATFSEPVWAPDSSTFVYCLPSGAIVRKDLRTGQESTIFRDPKDPFLTGWSPDGHTLLYGVMSALTGWDIWEARFETGRPQPFLASPGKEGHAQFSPDGRWVTYVSDESGPTEVWVRTYPFSDTRFRVSNGGGYGPQWRADGRALYYLDATSRLIEVDVRLDPTFTQGASRPLFQGFVNQGLAEHYVNQYVVSPDGQRFLFKTALGEDPPMMVSVNWSLPKAR